MNELLPYSAMWMKSTNITLRGNNREEYICIHVYEGKLRQTICDTRAQDIVVALKKDDVCNGQGHQDTISQCECSVVAQ